MCDSARRVMTRTKIFYLFLLFLGVVSFALALARGDDRSYCYIPRVLIAFHVVSGLLCLALGIAGLAGWLPWLP